MTSSNAHFIDLSSGVLIIVCPFQATLSVCRHLVSIVLRACSPRLGRFTLASRESGCDIEQNSHCHGAISMRRWSKKVTLTSNSLDLEKGVFSRSDPRSIARSLKRSAERSRRRKSDPFRSAMSMLVFYINRAGKNLSNTRRARLEAAKQELRDLFGRGSRAA
jgi:hypothetical protein